MAKLAQALSECETGSLGAAEEWPFATLRLQAELFVVFNSI